MRGWWIGFCSAFLVTGCVEEPSSGTAPGLLEPPLALAALVYGDVVTFDDISELQPIPGASDVRAAALNRFGRAVGSSGGRPVVWDEGVPSELPVPPGWEGVTPNSITDDGRIMGLTADRTLIWEDGRTEEFKPYPGRDSTQARFNGAGVAVGRAGSGEDRVAFVWKDGVATVLPPAETFERASAAYANATGMVLGTSIHVYSEDDRDEFTSFTIWEDGVVVDVVEGRPAPPEERAAGISDAADAFMNNTDGGWAIYRWRDGTVQEYPASEGQGQNRFVHAVSPDGSLLATWEGDLGVFQDDVFRPLDDGIAWSCGSLTLDAWVICEGPGREHPFVARLDLEPRSSPWVSDLAVTGITALSATLTWTQVGDGMGSPASYRLKYARPPIDWGNATIGCERTMHGTEIGAPMSCTAEGLEASTAYEFQLMSFRVVDGVWRDAQYSNRAAATTGTDRVTDLRQQSARTTTMRVEWTQVDDGTGEPARYRVKYSEPPITYSTAKEVCTIEGDEIGARAFCELTDLQPGTWYDVQLMSFRLVDGVWVDAKRSNEITARTSGASPDNVVNNLRVFANTYDDGSATVRLDWTQVEDGNGNPAHYRLRYGSPLEKWKDGTLGCDVEPRSYDPAVCTLMGLTPGTRYDFQLMSHGWNESGAWVNARYSNMVSVTAATG